MVDVIVMFGYIFDSVCYYIDGNVFVGDIFFMLDSGIVCCDFFGGSVGELYDLL